MIVRNATFIVSMILIALLSLALGIYLPWWIIAVVAFSVCAIFYQPPSKAFWSGFLSIFLLWAMLSSFIDATNLHLLSQKIARVLPLGGSSFLLILLSSFIGALVAGLAAVTGAYFRKMLKS
jgi:hypothetical protein